jgi:hypothetical protein
MKTNHRDGTRNRRARNASYTHGVNANIKEEARSNRRNIEDKVCDDVKAGRVDAEDVSPSTRAKEVANPWNWD